ncbi:MAG: FG-GAP-like repeat-containing protein [Bacteroidia bacterium]|nr:FG-GAP-like repeat-containing protein [Bacteroidia bacterium]
MADFRIGQEKCHEAEFVRYSSMTNMIKLYKRLGTSTLLVIQTLIFAGILIFPFRNYAQTFIEQTGISLPGVEYSSVAWGDYNNDGFLDFIITGETTAGTNISKVYKNNGNSTFTEQTGITLPGVCYSSVAWGDYNNDGYLDILLTGTTTGSYYNSISKIFKNNGNNTFTEQTNISISGVSNSSVAWGDYNNDGFLDILITGGTTTLANISKVYKNNGNNTFTEQTSISLPGVCYSSVAWGDYNNDGYLDFIITGLKSAGVYISEIFKNNGNGTFTEQATLIGVESSSVAWGDFNNDGYLDILLTGDNGTNSITKVYKNNGNNSFSALNISLYGVSDGSAEWGDYDNDGKLDILLTRSNMSRIYRNNGNNTFSTLTGISLPGAYYGSSAWADYDNDGKLDILLTGGGSTANISNIFKNNTGIANTPPSSPANLNTIFSGNLVTLSWDDASDAQTTSAGLSYNLRIGTTPGSSDLFPAMSDLLTGTRRIPARGNLQMNNSWTLNNLPSGTYYWSVQSIDPTFRASAFSSEYILYNLFTITSAITTSCPNNSSGSISLSVSGGNSPYSYQWSNSATTANVTSLSPGNYRVTISDNSGIFSIYNYSVEQSDPLVITHTIDPPNASINLTVSGGITPYSFLWSNGSTIENLTNLITGIYKVTLTDYCNDSITDSISFILSPFIEDANINLTGIASGKVAWGDYNNDGYLDILVTGIDITKIYRNNGNGTFTEQTEIILPGTNHGSCSWCDYNNDGYLDFILTGSISSSFISRIYKNIGGNNFIAQTGISLIGVGYGTCEWGDYNNDGYYDLLLAGNDGSGYVTVIYKNNGDNTFTQQTNISLIGGISAAWCDLDNDNDLDILVSYSTSTDHTYIYRNNGDGTFSQMTGISLSGIINGSASLGDFNSDGRTDIVLTGYNGNTYISNIYLNNGNMSFVLISNSSLAAVTQGSISLGDYNNDGFTDILLTGKTSNGTFIAKVYQNNGNNTFHEPTNISIVGVDNSSVAWGDYDNDGGLDILLSGFTGSTNINKIYKNTTENQNHTPAPPTNLYQIVSGNNVTLHWNYAIDTETSLHGLSYNIMMGTTTGGIDIISPMSDCSSGYHRIPQMGNIQEDNSWKMTNLPGGTYYWSVQGVDNGYMASPFSVIQSFTIFTLSATVSEISCWGNNNGVIDIIVSGGISPFNYFWSNGATNSNLSGLPPGNYSVTVIDNSYISIDTTITIAQPYALNITSSIGNVTGYNNGYINWQVSGGTTPYSYLWSNGLTTQNCYQLASGNYQVTVTDLHGCVITDSAFVDINLITELTNNNLPGMDNCSVAWGDYDNDGKLDFILAGNYITRIYRNNGNDVFTAQTGISLTGVNFASVAWGDYNNDGYLDILLTGFEGTNPISKIYKNNGNNTFTELTGVVLPGIRSGAAAWGDLNNDGRLDFLITGSSGSAQITKIFKNNGNDNFTELTSVSLPGLSNSAAAWGEYNKDGFPDLLIAGSEGGTNYVTLLFKNNGNETFTEQTSVSLPGVYNCAVAWGDYNNDGYPDFVLTGNLGYNIITKVYKNNNGNSFTEQTQIILPGVNSGSVAWGDFNNDGKLDLLLTGGATSAAISKIFINDGIDNFYELTGYSLTGVFAGSACWGDYDNDGDLDILLAGRTSSGTVSKIFRNNILVANQLPSAPAGLSTVINGHNVSFHWSASSDNETPAAGLSYNIMIGTSPGSCNILSAMSDNLTGFRKIPKTGNAQMNNFYTIKTLPYGYYYWCVQTIDNDLAGSPFSSSQLLTLANDEIPVNTFDITAVPNPLRNFTDIIIHQPEPDMIELKVYNSNGEKIKSLFSGQSGPGIHTYRLETADYSSGKYYVRIKGKKYDKSISIIIQK